MFYTYLWLRVDGTPYYVGKGCRGRAYLDVKGHRPPKEKSRILIQEFPSEADASAAEVFLISYYGRKDMGTGILRNLTDGGDGCSGLRHSDETRRKIGLLSKGRKASMATRLKMSEARTGTKRSATVCAKFSEIAKKRTYSPETREKMRQAKLGKRATPETRAKMSSARVGHTVSQEARAKMSSVKKEYYARRRGDQVNAERTVHHQQS